MFGERACVVVPRFLQDRLSYALGRGPPPRDIAGEPEALGQARSTVERHLAESRRVGEGTTDRADFPDALVGPSPFTRSGLDKLPEPGPQGLVDPAVVAGPLIRAIEDLSEDVVLALRGRAVAPPDGPGATVALEFAILAFGRGLTAVQVVQDMGTPVPLHGVEDPAQKAPRLAPEAHPVERVHGERGIADPRVAIVPIPRSADGFGQRGRGRGDHGAVLEMIE